MDTYQKKKRKSRQMSIQIMEMWKIFCEGEQAFHVILLSDRKYWIDDQLPK